jgi:hypothetical protein
LVFYLNFFVRKMGRVVEVMRVDLSIFISGSNVTCNYRIIFFYGAIAKGRWVVAPLDKWQEPKYYQSMSIRRDQDPLWVPLGSSSSSCRGIEKNS